MSSILRPPTSVGENLRRATLALEAAGVDSPRLTAEVLLTHVLRLTRTQLLSRPEQNIPSDALAHFDRLMQRAAAGEPLAYLIGRREFCGLDFFVNAQVLIPRPETELLVDLALRSLSAGAGKKDGLQPVRILDVGTGSGCIAVTLAVRLPSAHVTALDASPEALAVARHNAERYKVAERVTILRSDLLSALHAPFPAYDLICANLPYVPSDELRQLPVARYEPHPALDGGPDGLDVIRRFLLEAPRAVASRGRVLLEIGAAQGATVSELACAAFPEGRVEVRQDLAGLDRIVSVTL
jgi:release factor glutamine methyltransferase